jgi:hypothetical protein
MDGTGISNKWNVEQERADHERIIKNYKPRGTHTLGPVFGSKHGEKIIERSKEKEGNRAD